MWDMELEDDEITTSDTPDTNYESLSEGSIIPKVGTYLGLDISQNSSGICIYHDGIKKTYNSGVKYDEGSPFAEALMRKELKEDLLTVINDMPLDLVVIEDVFEGNNPEVVRKLYALNTAIDELIIEEKVICKDFVRVQNGVWKKWLSVVDSENKFRGLSDKEKIQGYLGMLGVSDKGEGFQDRLDATGMLLGYFLHLENKVGSSNGAEVLRVSFNDMEFSYELDDDLVKINAHYSRGEDIEVIYIDDTKLSKKVILEYIASDVFCVFITANPVHLGFLAKTLGMEVLETGGYFGFWISPRAIKKYKKRVMIKN